MKSRQRNVVFNFYIIYIINDILYPSYYSINICDLLYPR